MHYYPAYYYIPLQVKGYRKTQCNKSVVAQIYRL
jgi:hypothetical protein